jgi:N-acetylmuramoyl-L-alanine amidase
MPWSSHPSSHEAPAVVRREPCSRITGFLPIFGLVLVSSFLLSAAPQKRLSVYSVAANYFLPVIQRANHDYVALLELLDPLGRVNAKLDGRRWRIRYNNVEGEFFTGQNRARIQGKAVDLSSIFLIENGRGLVPVASLSSLLPRFLGGPVTVHEDSGRLFIGTIATHFTASLAAGIPPRLVFHFSSPVSPSVSTEPGKLHITFTREPVVAPASSTLTFGSNLISSATYSESNGLAEITVNTTAPLTPSFGDNGRTITLTPASAASQTSSATPTTPVSAAARPAANSPANSPASPPANPQANSPPSAPAPSSYPSAPRHYFAVVDPSHGGDDRGEALSSTLLEKDVTLALARRLRQELENRGISTLMLRDSDANLSSDQRAVLTNTNHAAIYIAVHVASGGHGVRLYTALLPYGSSDNGLFRSWSNAQSSFLPVSQGATASISAELQRQQLSVRIGTAPLRPLNNVTAAAVAIEVAPAGSDLAQLTSADYQQLIASAVATAIAASRDKLGATP